MASPSSKKPSRDDLVAARNKTVPDVIARGLRVLLFQLAISPR
jgi:hypothetical protein